MDGSHGILIVPVWKNEPWFWQLAEAAVEWWDLPTNMPIFQDNSGRKYNQRHWGTRVILFDALDVEDRKSDDRSQKFLDGISSRQWCTTPSRSVRSVIEADSEHP